MDREYLEGVALVKKSGGKLHIVHGPRGVADTTPVIASGTTVPRMLKDRFADVINVRDFGAKGDGTTDDTEAIQAAVNFAGEKGGGFIVFPSGTFIVETINILFNNIHLIGSGMGVTVLKAKQSKCVIDGYEYGVIQFNMPIGGYTGPSSIIPLKDCSVLRMSIDGSMTEDYANECENLISGDNADSVTARGHSGINSYRMSNFFIDSVHIYDCYNYGIGNVGSNFENRSNVHITNCIIERTARDGIDTKVGIENFHIENCDISYSGYITESRVGVLTDQVGIDLRPIEGFVSGNRIRKTVSAGIRIRDVLPESGEVQKIIIENNYLYDCGNAGLQISTRVTPIYISKNYSKGSTWAASISGTGLVSISGLYCDSGSSGGVWISNSNNETNGPRVYLDSIYASNTLSGVVCGRAKYLSVENSIFTGCSNNCISVTNAINIKLSGNRFIGNEDKTSNGVLILNSPEIIVAYSNYFYGLNTAVSQLPSNAILYGNKFESCSSIPASGFIFGNKGSVHDDYLTLSTDTRISFGGTLDSPSIFVQNNGLRINNFLCDQALFSNTSDNTASLGSSSNRWSQIYAASGTINTSDQRVKSSVASASDTLLDAVGSVPIHTFQFTDAVEKKGSDAARFHAGVIAQEVASAFQAKGLDAARYGLFCHDEWPDEFQTIEVVDQPEVLDENGEVVSPAVTHTEQRLITAAGDRYGIRYEELLMLECARLRRELQRVNTALIAHGITLGDE